VEEAVVSTDGSEEVADQSAQVEDSVVVVSTDGSEEVADQSAQVVESVVVVSTDGSEEVSDQSAQVELTSVSLDGSVGATVTEMTGKEASGVASPNTMLDQHIAHDEERLTNWGAIGGDDLEDTLAVIVVAPARAEPAIRGPSWGGSGAGGRSLNGGPVSPGGGDGQISWGGLSSGLSRLAEIDGGSGGTRLDDFAGGPVAPSVLRILSSAGDLNGIRLRRGPVSPGVLRVVRGGAGDFYWGRFRFPV
jgi:hypothetical protein